MDRIAGKVHSDLMESSKSLRELMMGSFDESELKDLAFDLGVNYEDLPPGGRADKIRDLILALERQQRIQELVEALKDQRPHVDWPETGRMLTEADLVGLEPFSPLPYEPETVEIPPGPFLMGSQEEGESPMHHVDLPRFRCGKHPITNEQYAVFLKHDRRRDAPRQVGWFMRRPPLEKLDHPVVGVSWHDAYAYCRWLSEITGRAYCLPSEAQWEKAARGLDGPLYPWGNEWKGNLCHHHANETVAVNANPGGMSIYGCLNMIGNVQEWTLTIWGADRHTTDYAYPYRDDDGREDVDNTQFSSPVYIIHRGGSFADDLSRLRCSARGRADCNSATNDRGFRIVLK